MLGVGLDSELGLWLTNDVYVKHPYKTHKMSQFVFLVIHIILYTFFSYKKIALYVSYLPINRILRFVN